MSLQHAGIINLFYPICQYQIQERKKEWTETMFFSYLLNFSFLLIGEFSGEKSGQGNDTKEEATELGRRKRNQISPEIPDRR